MVTLIRPRKGDWITSAIWYNADLPKDRETAEDAVTDVIFEMAWENKVRTKPIEWEHVDPMDPRVPTPPDHMQGNIMCAIGAAEVVHDLRLGSDFTSEIDLPDLIRLREATKKQFHMSGGLEMTDEEADELINEFAPEVAAKRPN